MKIDKSPIYVERRRNALLLTAAAILTPIAIKMSIDDDIKCEGSQTVVVKNNRLEDGTTDPNSHFTVWSSIDENVKFDSDTVNKQNIVDVIEDMNPGINFGSLAVGEVVKMPLSCSK